MRRKRMISWLIGIPVTVAVLIIIILIGEKETNGITRAAAYKAAALSSATVEECRKLSEEQSVFPASTSR